MYSLYWFRLHIHTYPQSWRRVFQQTKYHTFVVWVLSISQHFSAKLLPNPKFGNLWEDCRIDSSLPKTINSNFSHLGTLVFRISIGPTLIYYSNFSHACALIQVPTLISFQEFENNTWNLPMNSLNLRRKNTVKPFETKILLIKVPWLWLFRCLWQYNF